MKICFLLGGLYQNGGIGRVVSVLANRLADEPNMEILLLGYFDPRKPNLFPVSEKIEQTYFLPSCQSMTKTMLTGGERKLRSLLRKREVDVLIACGALYFPLAARACKGIHTKCICWEHTDPEGNRDYTFQNLARTYGIKRSDLNLVLTKRALRVYRERYRAKNTEQIYNPIDPEALRKAGDYHAQSKKIISVGRLTYPKNFEAAVEAAAQVLPLHPDWEWDVFGQGEELERLVALTEEKGIQGQMHFRGQVSDLYDRYSDYAFMVMTSRYEGFPMTLLEGMANALPLVSFDIPTGPDEIIEDGYNGFLIPASDLETMSRAITELMDHPELRRTMSEHCLQRRDPFSQEEIIKEWKAILKGIRD